MYAKPQEFLGDKKQKKPIDPKALQELAEQGDANAQFDLGFYYEKTIGGKEGLKKAVELYKKAEQQGHLNAKLRLGFCYALGKGVVTDAKEVIRCFNEAAEKGYAPAQLYLGDRYEHGMGGVKKDIKEAIRLYRLAAEQGNATANYKLGLCYKLGIGVPKDLKEAVRRFKLGAAKENVLAQHELGVSYSEGIGVNKNAKEAVRFFNLAAKKHPPSNIALGVYYENEKRDAKEAVKFYKLAAEQKDKEGQYCLGLCYKEGYGGEKNLKLAVHNFQLAAAQGHSYAEYELARYYIYLLQPRDLEQGVSLLLSAAEKNNEFALYDLGRLYETGALQGGLVPVMQGVEKDWKQAVAYYFRAAELGHEEAREKLERLGYSVAEDDKSSRSNSFA